MIGQVDEQHAGMISFIPDPTGQPDVLVYMRLIELTAGVRTETVHPRVLLILRLSQPAGPDCGRNELPIHAVIAES
jgi:hypothetical protein